MKIIDYTNDITNELKIDGYIKKHYSNSKFLFFDIETTGLSPKNSTLYLIGALWYEDNIIHIRQWFNEDGYSEKEIINTFNNFCKDYSIIIHFNGITFDIPYIKEKTKTYALSTKYIDMLEQLDIYKEIRSYKNLLGLENAKQVTIEKFIGVFREDKYTGKELINIYQRYVAKPDYEKEHLLLLHNHDDLLGMPNISKVLNYKALIENPELNIHELSSNDNEHNILISFNLPEYLNIPKRFLHTDKYGIYINILNTEGTMTIPIIKCRLKHFFKDYKNYYYLPNEDMAIHKSVASYVEPQNKEKASKENCYVIKEDSYIICPDSDYTEIFKNNYTDKTAYRTYTSLISASAEEKEAYVKSLIKLIH